MRGHVPRSLASGIRTFDLGAGATLADVRLREGASNALAHLPSL